MQLTLSCPCLFGLESVLSGELRRMEAQTIVVSDGRLDNERGLSVLELARFFSQYGCSFAYNLDGGGSATMVFMGEVLNYPTSKGDYKEREVSDIVYIGKP